MRDQASANTAAIRIIKVLYPNLLDVGCYSHTIDHVGEKFITPILTKFGNHWVSLFSHSPKAHLLWKSRTGQSIKSYSKTCWWSQWEMFNQMMLYFGDIMPFLEDNPELSPATTMKLKSILNCARKSSLLQVELASIIDAGEAFVKATYKLEGDAPVIFECYDILAELDAGIATGYFPNLNNVCATLSSGVLSRATELREYGLSCVQPGLQYYQEKFGNDLKESVEAFKAARLFVPTQAVELKPDANTIDSLAACPFLTSDVIAKLKSELPSYLVKAADASSSGLCNRLVVKQ